MSSQLRGPHLLTEAFWVRVAGQKPHTCPTGGDELRGGPVHVPFLQHVPHVCNLPLQDQVGVPPGRPTSWLYVQLKGRIRPSPQIWNTVVSRGQGVCERDVREGQGTAVKGDRTDLHGTSASSEPRPSSGVASPGRRAVPSPGQPGRQPCPLTHQHWQQRLPWGLRGAAPAGSGVQCGRGPSRGTGRSADEETEAQRG